MTDNRESIFDWKAEDDVFPILQWLQGRGLLTVDLWRRFQCACCRDIWDFMTDERCKNAIQTAEKVLHGDCDPSELFRAHETACAATDDAWDTVHSLIIPNDPGVYVWPISQEADDAWVKYSAAEAAKTCTEVAEKRVLFSTTPDSAACVRPWHLARIGTLSRFSNVQVEEDLRDEVVKRWEEIKRDEEKRQTQILLDMVVGTIRP